MRYDGGGCLSSLTMILFANAVLKMSHAQDDDDINRNPVVTIAQGKVAGKLYPCRHNNYALGFVGIPYAQPPVGNLRFHAPLPAKGWGEKTFDGTKPGAACPQNMQLSVPIDEDCLHISVYTPELPNDNVTSLLPTLFYVIGGLFLTVPVAPEVINPTYFFGGLQKAVLAVPSFRVGPFGFLSMGNEEAPGNYGMKDIVLALKWVQQNIQAFGGDPSQVTVVGHSSGATSAHLLTLSPLTARLFHRVGTGSGTFSVGWTYSPRRIASRHADLLCTTIGCTQDTSTARLRCLREKPVDVILRASTLTVFMNPRELPVWHITDEPDIEGAFLTDNPRNLMAAGKFHDVPWINGVTRDEGLVFSSRAYLHMNLVRQFLPYFDDLLTIAPIPYQMSLNRNSYAKALNEYYFNDHNLSDAELFDNFTHLVGEIGMIYPACLAMKDWASQAKSPVYFYSFDYVGSNTHTYRYCECADYLGVGHADDVLYLFNIIGDMKELANKTMTDKDFEMVDAVVRLWIAFATDGIPSLGPGTPTWKPFTIANESVLSIGQENNIVFTLLENYCRDRMTALDHLFAKLT